MNHHPTASDDHSAAARAGLNGDRATWPVLARLPRMEASVSVADDQLPRVDAPTPRAATAASGSPVDAPRRRIDGPERALSAAHLAPPGRSRPPADETAISGRMLRWYGRCAPYADVAMTLALAASAALLYWAAFGHPSRSRAPSVPSAPLRAPATAADPSGDARLGLQLPTAHQVAPSAPAPAWPDAPALALDEATGTEPQGARSPATEPSEAAISPPLAAAGPAAPAILPTPPIVYVPPAYPNTGYHEFTAGPELFAALAAAKNPPPVDAAAPAAMKAPPMVASLPDAAGADTRH